MAFSYPPLDLYYSFSMKIRNDQLNEEKKKGFNDYVIVKREVEQMFKFLRNTIKYSWNGYIQFYFGFNENSWYIFKYNETEEHSYFMIFGIQLRIVCSFNSQISFIRKSDEINTYIKNYYMLYSPENLMIEARNESALIKQENKENFDIFEKYCSFLNMIREKKEYETGEKIQIRRYFTIDEIEKYKSIENYKETNDTTPYFDYIDMKYY